MKKFIAIFREPDGRAAEVLEKHKQKWNLWLHALGKAGRLGTGSSLTVEGRIVRGPDIVETGIHTVGTEIVGGFLLIDARDLEDAARVISTCPIYEIGGYAEVRKFMRS